MASGPSIDVSRRLPQNPPALFRSFCLLYVFAHAKLGSFFLSWSSSYAGSGCGGEWLQSTPLAPPQGFSATLWPSVTVACDAFRLVCCSLYTTQPNCPKIIPLSLKNFIKHVIGDTRSCAQPANNCARGRTTVSNVCGAYRSLCHHQNSHPLGVD